MTRTKGAKDLKKRKHRVDRTRKYVHRKGVLVPYRPKREKTDPIKVWFWEKVKMSPEGQRKWNRHIRGKMTRNPVVMFRTRVDLSPARISTRAKVEALALDVQGYSGEFMLMGFSHGKNKFHVKPVMLCRITITQTSKGLIAKCYDTTRLSRYWFWEERN